MVFMTTMNSLVYIHVHVIHCELKREVTASKSEKGNTVSVLIVYVSLRMKAVFRKWLSLSQDLFFNTS